MEMQGAQGGMYSFSYAREAPVNQGLHKLCMRKMGGQVSLMGKRR